MMTLRNASTIRHTILRLLVDISSEFLCHTLKLLTLYPIFSIYGFGILNSIGKSEYMENATLKGTKITLRLFQNKHEI
jgi:prepilin signal peptidase PulO-like enzyme (type II secretory pathway)